MCVCVCVCVEGGSWVWVCGVGWMYMRERLGVCGRGGKSGVCVGGKGIGSDSSMPTDH